MSGRITPIHETFRTSSGSLLHIDFARLFARAIELGTRDGSGVDYETAHLSRIATAIRVTETITVDGQLEERTWMQASPVSDFTQQVPRTGQPATERTEVRFLYDDENLYVGVKCFDSYRPPGNLALNPPRAQPEAARRST